MCVCLCGCLYPPAYQLRVCQPPPEVSNVNLLMEDGELEIGECASAVPLHKLSVNHHHKCDKKNNIYTVPLGS